MKRMALKTTAAAFILANVSNLVAQGMIANENEFYFFADDREKVNRRRMGAGSFGAIGSGGEPAALVWIDRES